jgi:hypothetical protein
VLHLTVALLLFLALTGARLGATWAQAADQSFVGVNGDSLVLDGQPYVLKGFNYYPRDYGWSSMTEWDWTQVDQELALASSVGANTIRVSIDYGYSTGHPDEVWSEADVQQFQTPTQAYMDAMRQLLAIADSHGLKVIFGLFDYEPSWSFIGRADYAPGVTYLQTIIPAFADDPRIAAWSVFNEGDTIPEKFPNVSQDAVIQFNRAMADAIRPLDAHHLVTVDFARIWNAHLAQDFVDLVSFHYYADPAALPDQIQALRSRLNRPLPVVFGELGSPSGGNQYASVPGQTIALDAYLDTALFGQPPLAGALVWDLVDQNTPRTPLNRQREKGDLKLGMWDGNLQPKPGAAVVERYFSGGCGPGQRVELRFPNAPNQPAVNSQRVLQVGMRRLALVRGDGSTINQVQFGTPDANLVEGSGWYGDEDWGQWAGQPNRSASLCLAVPDDAASVRIQAHALQPDTVLEVWVQGVMQGAITLQPTDSEQTIALQPRS